MKIFAIGDLHLGHSVDKPMDIFGVQWRHHASRIAESWTGAVGKEDLILIPGDFSWAMRMEDAEEDLQWLERLPGTKLIIKGNHDYWWPSISRLRQRFQGGAVHPLQYDSISIGGVAVGGTRLWTFPAIASSYRDPLETVECSFSPATDSPGVLDEGSAHDEKIFKRELSRLENSLRSMDPGCELRIVMTHFPPTDEAGRETPVTRMLERNGTNICVFGHLHSLDLPEGKTWDFVKNGVRYVLVSCDAVGFSPYFLHETV